jgi:hypothetical protein
MLERGYLATTLLFASCAHTDAHLRKYLKTVDEVFATLKDAVETDTVKKRLKGPEAHTGFQRLN